LDGIDITANLIPAPFGLPLESGGAVIAGGALSGGPLLSLTVTDNEGTKSDSVTLDIDNRSQIPAPKKGAKMKIWLGYVETGLIYMGTYVVDNWSKSGRPRKLTVNAKAAGMTTELKSPRSRSYHKKKVGDIVGEIAGRHGLSQQVHPELKDFEIGHIDQSSESDLNFLSRLAKRIGGNFKLADEKLIMNKAGSAKLPSGSEAPTFTLIETGQTDWEATGSERGSYKSATAAWVDPKTGKRETVLKGEGTPRYRDRRVFKTESEAQRAVEAQLDGLKRGKISFSTSFPGRPEIFAGSLANVTNHDPDVDGLFVVKTATHTVDNNGLKTSLSCESKNGGEKEE
jgi:phage protein D